MLLPAFSLALIGLFNIVGTYIAGWLALACATAAFAAFSVGRPRPIHLEVALDLLEEVGDAALRRALAAPPGTPRDTPMTGAP